MSTARLGGSAGRLVALPWRPGIMKTHVGVTLVGSAPGFREIWQIRTAGRQVGCQSTGLADGAAGPPVDTDRGAGHELLVDQVPAQRAVVIEDLLEDVVDGRFRVPAAGLERLNHLVEQQTTPGALGRNRGDLAVPDERPQLLRRFGEEAVRVFVHLGQYDAGAADLASEIPQAVPFRGGTL